MFENKPESRTQFEQALNKQLDWILSGLPQQTETTKQEIAYFLVNPQTKEENNNYCNRTAKRLAKHLIAPGIKTLSPEQRKQAEFIHDKLLTVAQSTLNLLYQDAVHDVGEEFIKNPAPIREEVANWQKRTKEKEEVTPSGPPSIW